MKIKIALILMLSMLFVPSLKVVEANNEDTKIVELSPLDINGFYTQEEDSPATIYEEANGNQYIRLSYSTSEFSSFYFDSIEAIYQNGIYKFEADIRYNEDLSTDNIFIYIFGEKNGVSKDIAKSVSELNEIVTPIPNSEWKRLSMYINIEDYYVNLYECFKFGFNTMKDKNNYIDVDNISISLSSAMEFSGENLDKNRNGDFEQFEEGYKLDTPGWHQNDTYYVSETLENEVINEEGNKVLKLYSSTSDHVSIDKGLNVLIAEEGWYRFAFKAKPGKDFSTDNVGFRIDSSNGILVGDTAINYYGLKKDQYVTLEAKFYMGENPIPEWLNLSLWVFNHNDTNFSLDNYLLIDDLEINRKNNGGDFNTNLLSNGDVSGFYPSQGRVFHDISYGKLVTKYPYCQTVIDKDILKKFPEGKKLVDNCKEQDYWGTIDYDVAAEMKNVDGYHAAVLSYDGKQKTKTYSSLSYLLDYVEMSTKKYYILDFDYKLEVENTDTVTVAFIGIENMPDFEMDLLNASVGKNNTKGCNRNVYTYVVTAKENGWYNCQLIFKPDIAFKARVTALRFLLNAKYNQNNKCMISNISMTEYSDVEYEDYQIENPKQIDQELMSKVGIGAIVVLVSIATIAIVSRRRRSW